MAADNINFSRFDGARHNMQGPVLVQFPNGLRNDGLADTYLMPSGETVLLPDAPHDFDFAARLASAGLTRGIITTLQGRQGIQYPRDADFVGLSAVMNAAVNVEDGRDDITHSLRLVGELAKEMKRRIGAIPTLNSIEAVAIDRTTNRAELLPPYQVSSEAGPESIFYDLRQDAYGRTRSTVEHEMITQCFAAAHESFVG